MNIIADLHIHSKYSRACSTALDIANLEKWARIKGLGLLGTGDFTHPKWSKEIKKHLSEDESGILRTKTNFPFALQTEISLIYTDEDKGRRVHHVILAPNLEVVSQITEYLLTHGRIDYDGRPIFKIPSDMFVYELRKISKDIEVIPAHIWTPWFGMFGSKSGFDSMKECFKDQEKHVHAIETGISSDPAMNWRLSQLDKKQIVSFSDSHSFWPWRIGREATIFDLKKFNYKNLLKAIRTGNGLSGTIEVDPAYGKYHFDGHRNCNIMTSPAQSIKMKNFCPECRKELTLGVAHRVEELADRPQGYKLKNAKPYYSMLPLSEIISAMKGKAMITKAVWTDYDKLRKRFGSEYDILLKTSQERLSEEVHPKIAELIIKNRQGKLKVNPGYDGVYGELEVESLNPKEAKEKKRIIRAKPKQKDLGKFF